MTRIISLILEVLVMITGLVYVYMDRIAEANFCISLSILLGLLYLISKE